MVITGKEDIFYVSQKSEDKSIFTVQMCGITYPEKNYEIERHHSQIVCIEYIEKGCGTVNISDETFYPEEGDAYILPLGLYHHYYSDTHNPWKKIFLNIRGSLVESLIEGYQLNSCHHFKNLDIKNEIYSIIDLAKKSECDCTKEIICIVNQIFLKMRRSVSEKSDTPNLAEKMKDFINLNATKTFKIEELCKHISRSESQTIRIFKSAYGTTPYAYALKKRISLAKDMLINTNLSVKQIAYNLSFTDEYYFSNIFKAKTGQSPTSYRKRKL